ncbi:TonB-dependent receptor [Rhodanobacter sp. T12-5]|uniref:TonB-dependent receptor domain-containing protein n=1 Tax=Rhodanobacter sp. T12-5 TaxID=2024611 RepID=UPI0011EC9932|nr:TonB-dependent receptor [Rhodanobacter sp. T12-5]KAA0071753.1 TonB-dependent receptor [Rhodanobacter sp. T12-5]
MIKSKIAVAVVAALAFGYTSAYAQSAPTDASQQSADQAPDSTKVKKLEAVTVTGSLIPQTEIETATPTITITAQEMKARGFTTVAEALQQSSFATGSVQGSATSASFTQGAQTLSMFGLPVGFVKYLIDGRPMGNFPGLYNGSDAFNNLSGIPMDMVERIDVLPGGQSSLYGSDAIAGVINIILKKHIDAPTIDVRYGWHKDGGGATRRISLADGFSAGKFNALLGVQFEKTQPIWGTDRSLTRQFFTEGTSAPIASRDYLVNSGTGAGYLFLDPANCSNVTGQFHGTEAKQHRAGSGDYCGSFTTPGYKTITNDDKTANLYAHTTFDVSDNLQLYGDVLYNYEEQKYAVGSNYTWWGTSVDYGYIYDPNLDDFVNLQRAFSPEDVGGSYRSIMNKQIENSYLVTLGGKGTFGQSNWDYDLGFSHSDDKLLNHDFQRFAAPIDAYFESHVMGPQLPGPNGDGLDPYYGAYPIFAPNYAAFYQPMSKADFDSFTGFTDTRSKTWDNMVRGQLTNASLFSVPGGDAGIAVVVEGGNQGWDYTPDPRLLNGEVWGTTSVQGGGHRSRFATTAELKVPLLSQLTLDASGRYDSYKVAGGTVSHKTYNLALEYRPFESLLLRGRYGTAFKIPTLADEFQGLSGYYSQVTDYLNCGRLGFSGANIDACPSKYNAVQFFGQQAGSPTLQPITAKVWSYGFVWAPMAQMSFSVDYLHWDINNEVNTESADGLSNTEYLCEIGTLDMNSPTCQNAFSKITRGTSTNPALLGDIKQIYTPKVNVSNEQVNAITADFGYAHDIGAFGKLAFHTSYSDVLKHTVQSYPNDPVVDVLRNPNWSTDFKTKLNASLTWSLDKWSVTAYGNRYGRTPNYLASQVGNYTAKGTGKLPAWTLYNASVTYNPVPALGLSLLVNNLFNKMPPMDHSYPGSSSNPYNSSNYNVYGRAMYIEANYKFGVK